VGIARIDALPAQAAFEVVITAAGRLLAPASDPRNRLR
jgi:hypothetical protein